MSSFDWLELLHQDTCFLPSKIRGERGGEVLLTLLGFYQQMERSPSADLILQQGMLLGELARYCATHSPYFGKRLREAGLTAGGLTCPDGLSQLAPMSRRELVEAGAGLFCTEVPAAHGRITMTSTSGSTGEPVVLRRPELCLQHWNAHNLREHLWHRRDASGKLAVIRANMEKAIKLKSWGPPVDQLLNTGPAEARPTGESIAAIAAWLFEFQPNELLILPNTLAGILQIMETSGARLENLRAVRTLSETVTPRLREEVKRVLGLEIADVYSSQEGGVMATQCPEYGLYHVSETLLLEILRDDGAACEPGETGRVVITDLLNFATPLIRYEIGDYAEAGPQRCLCGRSSPTVKRFLGRERNLLLRPDGSRQWPMVGYRRWSELLPIRQFQFIQEDRQTITARFSIASRPDAATEARLTSIIQSALGYDYVIHYEWHDGPLARGAGGKFEEFICRAT